MKIVKYLFLRPIKTRSSWIFMRGSVESESAFREEANGADERTGVYYVSGWVVSISLDA